MGFAILLAFAAYFAVLLLAVRWAVRRARAAGKSPLIWGGTAAAAIVLPVFWDWLPTILVHRYYCETKTYARVYKTAEEWRAEHPADIASVQPTATVFTEYGSKTRSPLNSRFFLEKELTRASIVPVFLETYRIIDKHSMETMVESSIASAGYGSIATGGADWRIAKFWVTGKACGAGMAAINSEVRAFGGISKGVE